MKFIIDRDALLSAMARVGGIVARRGTIPILANVLLDATADGLTVQATDLDLQALVTVPARVEVTGRTTVSAQSLSDIAKSVAEGAEIKAEVVETRLNVSAGRARWKLPILAAEEFPALQQEEWPWSATLPGAAFADAINRVSWAISNDAGKLFINGARIEIEDGQLIAVATQGAQIVVARIPCDAPDHPGLTVPSRTCQEMAKFCAEYPDVTLSMAEAKVQVEVPGASLTSKVLNMRFAEWRRLMGLTYGEAFTVDRNALTSAIRRAMIGAHVASDGHMIKLGLSPGAIVVSGRSTNTEASDDVEAAYEGPETHLGVNAAGIMEALGAMRRDDVSVSFNAGKETPLFIRCEGDETVVCVSTLLKVA